MDPRLDRLPSEILKRIASLSDASSVIVLAQTCRSFHHLCWDPLVFRDLILRNKSTFPLASFDLGSIESKIKTDPLKWAKVALADQHAGEFRGGLDGPLRGHSFERALQWAPHMIACRHPFTTSPWLALKLSEVVHGMALDLRGVFCYTAAMLGTNDDGNDMVATSQEAMRQMPEDVMKARTRWKALRALGAFATLLRQDMKLGRISDSPGHMGDYTAVPDPSQAADPGAPISYISIRLENYNPRDIPGSVAVQRREDLAAKLPIVKPPSAIDIPMLPLDSTYSLPLPFTPLSQRELLTGGVAGWESWYNGHVRAMSMPAFLKKSEWHGFLKHQGVSSWGECHGFTPLVDVVVDRVFEQTRPPRYLANRAGNPTKPALQISASGRECQGRFTLEGTVDVDGKVLCRKLDRHSQASYWALTMTPFGIFGNWSLRDGRNFSPAGGAVWLWRKEWSNDCYGQ